MIAQGLCPTSHVAFDACTRASAIKYGEMQHAGVLVADVPAAVKFYTEVNAARHGRGFLLTPLTGAYADAPAHPQVLGMRDESNMRPNLPYPGVCFFSGMSILVSYDVPRAM